MAYQSRQQALSELHTQIEEMKKVWDDIYLQIASKTELELTTAQIVQQTDLVKSMISESREKLNQVSILSEIFR